MRQSSKPYRAGTGIGRLLPGAIVAVFLSAGAARADVPQEARNGARLFDDSAYAEAADAFRRATIAAPDDPRWRYDLGLSEAVGQDFENALNNLQTTAETAPMDIAAPAWFNAGNVHFARGDYTQAAAAYRQALLIDSDDPDAKRNLELALQRMQEQQSGSEEGESKDQEQDQNEGDQNQEQQQQQDQEQKQPQEEQDPEDDQSSDSQEPNQDPQSQQQQEEGQSDSTLTREQAERILRALADEEARLRNQARRLQALPAPGGKDW